MVGRRGWSWRAGAVALMVGVLVLLSNPDIVLACTCPEAGGPLEEMAVFDAVFAGRVVSVEHTFDPDGGSLSPWDHSKVGFRVSTVWKGDVAESVELVTPTTGESCGYAFEEDTNYIVYASGSAIRGGYTVDICSRTAPLVEARADIDALGRGQAPGATAQGEPRGAGSAAGSGIAGAVVVGALVVAGAAMYARRRRG